MAKKAGIIPTWVKSLGAILDEPQPVIITAHCYTCGLHKQVDVAALAAKVGREYSLVNRRCRCKLRAGCKGWNVFHYGTGTWNRPMADEATLMRWMTR